jgi:predicted nucleic acid-binding protein
LRTVVLDASVALKLAGDEEESDAADLLLQRCRFLAPGLITLECANAIWLRVRHGLMTEQEASGTLADLLLTPIELIPDEALAPAAAALAGKLPHPVYDCAYLALALERGTFVVTADRRFAGAAGRHPFYADRVRLLSEVVTD